MGWCSYLVAARQGVRGHTSDACRRDVCPKRVPYARVGHGPSPAETRSVQSAWLGDVRLVSELSLKSEWVNLLGSAGGAYSEAFQLFPIKPFCEGNGGDYLRSLSLFEKYRL